MKLLEVNNLKVSFNTIYGRVTAVDGVSFCVNNGEILGIVGESGSGKSVTSLSIMNLIEKEKGGFVEGEVLFEGTDLLKLKEKEMCNIRGNKISMIFQEPMTSLNPVFNVYKQINEVYKTHGRKNNEENKEKIINILEQLNIPKPESILKKYPFELSGGMRQRIMIAMAIACNPQIIIADEPTTALDVTTQAEILDLLKKITQRTNSSIMLITHDLGIIAELAQRVIVMYRGKVVEKCNVLKFFDSPFHPYSKGLINAMPNNFDKRFYSINGNVPSIYEEIEGCAYASRCPNCMEICKKKVPQMRQIEDDHSVACWLGTN
ncbi:ABC transporter ATP-binding protein [Clostridium sp. Cult2]|uniref:ABC transporter ATP-binding protein n=1 Tax=Clostridium sp. Cult2 TaxID=2079003 RepID=UPI001F34D7D7|nr:ABC transporter ATP-binding protein [Clostridium sp. Cult2]MCF6466561.1 peptide ABC transporter ATP-binding protein [Clostridium sp. Cult2]